MFLTICASSQKSAPTGTLTFNISGFSDNTGQVLVQLFRKEDKVPKNPLKVVKAVISNQAAVVQIENFSFGEYAAIVVHDKNSNEIIDHRWGMPNEPLGYTNNWQLTLFSGMPTFEKLKFTFNKSANKYEIVIKE
jgi:uncharacterized protein (DUF2141 family)